MKRGVIVLFLFLCHAAAAQHYVGVRVGYGAGHARVYPEPDKNGMVWGKMSGGVGWKYFSPQAIWGGVGAEVEYQQRGYKIYDGDVISDTTSYVALERRSSAVTVPIVWYPHLYMFKRSVRLFLTGGATFTYNLGTGEKDVRTDYTYVKEEKKQYVTTTTTPYVMNTARDVRWNYGAVMGAGVGVLRGRWEVVLEGRYYWGMADLIRNKTKYKFNELNTDRLELSNLTISLAVFVRLGKGGILAPPLRKRPVAPSGADDFRNIKLKM